MTVRWLKLGCLVASLVLVVGCSKPSPEGAISAINEAIATQDGEKLQAHFTKESLASSMADYMMEQVDKRVLTSFAQRAKTSLQGAEMMVPEKVRLGVVEDTVAKLGTKSPLKGLKFEVHEMALNGDTAIATLGVDSAKDARFHFFLSKQENDQWMVTKISKEFWRFAYPPDQVHAAIPTMDEMLEKYGDQLPPLLRETPLDILEQLPTYTP